MRGGKSMSNYAPINIYARGVTRDENGAFHVDLMVSPGKDVEMDFRMNMLSARRLFVELARLLGAFDEAEPSSATVQKKCTCDLQDLMRQGCQCGGK
jgi:hypothetical protein